MELLVDRTIFTAESTGGKLYIDADYRTPLQRVCETLEDPRRFPGVKVKGDTCIPSGRYLVTLSESSRFRRVMPMISNRSNGYQLTAENISFSGIRIHGGNTAKNTEGCLLVAYKRLDDNTIQGTA